MLKTILLIGSVPAFLFLLAFFLGATSIRFNGKPGKNQTRVACIGDSTTYGTAMPNNMHNSYPAQLRRLLGDGYHVANFGIHGKTVQDTNDDSYRRTRQYALSLGYDPDVVIIMLGANDTKPQNWTSLEEFTESYRQLVASYIDLECRREIKLCTPASIYHMRGRSDGYAFDIDDEKLQQVCCFVRRFADENQLELIDIHEITSGHRDWYEPDGVHPNKKGAHAIAASVFPWIADDI